MSQTDRVLDLLRSAGVDGVCSMAFYALHLPNGRNRVGELRDRRGHDIETVPTCHHDDHTPAHVRYVLHPIPRRARQMALAITLEEDRHAGGTHEAR